MNGTLSVARRQALPTAVAADRLLHILHVLDHAPHLYSGCTFWTLGILAQQRTLGWDRCQLTVSNRGNRREPEEHIEDWTFHRTRPAPSFPANLSVGRHRYLIKALHKQPAGVQTG